MELMKPKDMIALFVLLSFVFLIFNGIDSPLVNMIGLVGGYYFGARKSGHDNGI